MTVAAPQPAATALSVEDAVKARSGTDWGIISVDVRAAMIREESYRRARHAAVVESADRAGL